MQKLLIALTAALLASAAWSDTLVTNVNGFQADAAGHLQHFTGLLIGDDGKVKEVLNGPPPAVRYPHIVDAGGRTLLPGLIDGHGHVIELGLDALRLDVTGTHSIGELQQRLRDYAAAHPGTGGFSALDGTRNCGRRSASRRPPTSTPSSATGRSRWSASTVMRWSPTARR